MRAMLLPVLLALPAFAPATWAQGLPDPPAAERVVPGGRAGWVSDGHGGCWLWAGGLEAGASGIAGTWTGPCPNGPAEGEGRSVIGWQVGGRQRQMVWEGPLRGGKAEGRGSLVVSEDGQVITRETGEYRDDRLVNGRLEIPRTGLVYEGGWAMGQPNGQGELRLGGQVLRGAWENGCLKVKGRWVSFTRPPEQCEGQAL